MPGEFWIAAGINGAGKSSVVAAEGIADVIGPVRFLNPDLPVPSLRAHLAGVSLEEANLAAVVGVEAIVGLRIGRAETVGVETVLSSDKYLKHVRAARQRGMLVGMVYVALPDVELAIARVRDRRALGGHDVPEASVRARMTTSPPSPRRWTCCSSFPTPTRRGGPCWWRARPRAGWRSFGAACCPRSTRGSERGRHGEARPPATPGISVGGSPRRSRRSLPSPRRWRRVRVVGCIHDRCATGRGGASQQHSRKREGDSSPSSSASGGSERLAPYW